ncbi:MAG: flagellar M-ring protein FliF C-terminal domain-containing protein [Phycisphaeraceae bacterium]
MEWIRKSLAQIQAQMSEMSVSMKMLIGVLCAVILAALLLVALYSGTPATSSLLDQPSTAEQRAVITSYLDGRGIKYTIKGDSILVPTSRRYEIMAGLQIGNLLPEDAGNGFSSLVEKQSWWQSNEQNRQLYTYALQNELASNIRKMRGVSGATVFISRPESRGFDATFKRPTASVNVMMSGGKVDQKLADAIAGMVAGSVAEMKAQDVAVIDAAAGTQFRKRDEADIVATDYLELVAAQEAMYRAKVTEALGYIPKVIVAVNVEVDPKRVNTNETVYSNERSVSLIKSETTKTQNSSESKPGGEPGVRANTGISIPGASENGRKQNTEETMNEYDPHAGVTQSTTFDPGGVPTRVSATVNVPRSYFVALFMQGNPRKTADTKEPDDAALQPLMTEHLDRIKKQVTPLLTTKQAGQVVVDVYPDTSPVLASAGVAVGSGGMSLLSGGMVRYASLGALAMVSLLAMFMMLRKASAPMGGAVPSAAELAGLPAQINTASEMLGEAGEADSALPGIELDDEQIATRQIAEQVGEMVKNKPAEAANLLRQWLKQEA